MPPYPDVKVKGGKVSRFLHPAKRRYVPDCQPIYLSNREKSEGYTSFDSSVELHFAALRCTAHALAPWVADRTLFPQYVERKIQSYLSQPQCCSSHPVIQAVLVSDSKTDSTAFSRVVYKCSYCGPGYTKGSRVPGCDRGYVHKVWPIKRPLLCLNDIKRSLFWFFMTWLSVPVDWSAAQIVVDFVLAVKRGVTIWNYPPSDRCGLSGVFEKVVYDPLHHTFLTPFVSSPPLVAPLSVPPEVVYVPAGPVSRPPSPDHTSEEKPLLILDSETSSWLAPDSDEIVEEIFSPQLKDPDRPGPPPPFTSSRFSSRSARRRERRQKESARSRPLVFSSPELTIAAAEIRAFLAPASFVPDRKSVV